MAHRLSVVLVFCAAFSTLGGCGTVSYDYSKEPDPRKSEYVIGVGDGIHINVWKNQDLTTTSNVRPDGTITMPLVGDVHAAGRTPSQLTAEIGEKLKTFVKEDAATVSVAVTDVASYRITVSGNAEHPGVFPEKYYVTVADAIALAGGLNKFASPHKIVILRSRANGGVRKIPIDFDRVESGDHPEENLVLLAGDTLFIP
jgi:polysaccharide export outer membrane protein